MFQLSSTTETWKGLCLFPSPTLEISASLQGQHWRTQSEETKGTYTQSTHMELWAPVIKPGTSVAFSGCLRVQVISPRPAVPFSLFTLYAPIASTTTVCPKSISSDGSPKEQVFCCCLFFGRREWKRTGEAVIFPHQRKDLL